MPEKDNWKLKGDFVMSCNCTVFCPCVLSLGQHQPTEGYCQTWAGIRIDEGHHEDTDLAGVKAGLLIDIPGPLARGNWTAALYVDDKASIYAVKALTRIFSGKAGGSTGLLKILVGSFLGVRTEPIHYDIKEDGTHIFQIPKIIEGVVKPIKGKDAGRERRHPQHELLGRQGCHGRARRNLARARLRPQLEFRRPLGRAGAARLGQRCPLTSPSRNRDAARERAGVRRCTSSRPPARCWRCSR